MFSKGRFTWEVLIAGLVMGLFGAISNHLGFNISAETLKHFEKFGIEIAVKDNNSTPLNGVDNNSEGLTSAQTFTSYP